MKARWLLVATVLTTLLSYSSPLPARPGVRVYEADLSGLGWSPATSRIYGIGQAYPDSIVRIDPETGASQSFPVGPGPSKIVIDSGGGAWVACDGDGTIRRVNLETMAVEESIAIPGPFQFTDLAVSQGDPFTLVACREENRTFPRPRAYYVRRGVLLPDSVRLWTAVIENGTVFGIHEGYVWRLIAGPTGFIAGERLSYSGSGGELESYAGRIYVDSGAEVDAETGEGLPGFAIPLLGSASIAVNGPESTVYLLSGGQVLSRFDRLSREHTGLLEFPETSGRNLTAWSNRVAFAASNGRLYVVDTEKAFLPADLEVIQTVSPANPIFGETPVVSLIITNKGPGPAVNFHWSAAFDPSFFVTPVPHGFSNVLNFDYHSLFTRAWETTLYPSGPPNSSGIFSAGRYLTVVSLPLLPLRSGLLTNRLTVLAHNDTNSANNTASFVVPISAPSSNAPVVRLPLSASGVAAEPASGRLFVNAQGQWMTVNPGEFALSQPINTGTMRAIAFSENNPLAFIGYPDDPGTVALVDTRTFGTTVRKARGRIYDVALSPVAGASHFAVSDSVGLSEGKFDVPGERFFGTAPGPIEYSADGQRLYHLNINTCSLQIFVIARESGGGGTLTLEHTEPNLSCADFTRAGSLLYFDDGTVYDPAARQKLAKITGVSTPGYVSPDRSGHVNALTRTNGVWIVRRYATNDLAQPVAVVEIGPLPAGEAPLDAVSFGDARFAFSTFSSLFLVSLAESSGGARVTARVSPGGNITFRFATVAGGRYGLEASSRVNQVVWTRLDQEAAGTGDAVELTIPAPESKQFFRLVQR